VAIAVLAIAQMGVHVVFFLHITTGPDNTNNEMALAFGVRIMGCEQAGEHQPCRRAGSSSVPLCPSRNEA
jgi:cytochrome o ubiquinol oxidase subunit IV